MAVYGGLWQTFRFLRHIVGGPTTHSEHASEELLAAEKSWLRFPREAESGSKNTRTEAGAHIWACFRLLLSPPHQLIDEALQGGCSFRDIRPMSADAEHMANASEISAPMSHSIRKPRLTLTVPHLPPASRAVNMSVCLKTSLTAVVKIDSS